MKTEKRHHSELTDKDCDDWFAILEGKKVTGAHPTIQQDATILRTIIGEENKKNQQENGGNSMEWILNLQFIFPVLFLSVFSFFIYNMLFEENTINENNKIVHNNSANYEGRGFIPNKNEEQPSWINALNSPIMINNLTAYIESLEKDLKSLLIEKDEYDNGTVISITIKKKPKDEIVEHLQYYGFSEEIGEQFKYFKEKNKK